MRTIPKNLSFHINGNGKASSLIATNKELFSNDLENWMGKIPAVLRKIPLIYLAIPGSHDSMSYGIKSHSDVAPDADPIVSKVYKVLPHVVRKWAITQFLDARNQLMNGIRYFDLRISINPRDTDFYFIHGLYAERINEPLNQIKEFLSEHPNECVILDFQHMYNFTGDDYLRLAEYIKLVFGGLLYQRVWKNERFNNLRQLTLDYVSEEGKQVLVIYRTKSVEVNEFWTGNYFPTPWPQKMRTKDLEEFLDKSLQYRFCDTGFISQCVLTPTVYYVILKFYSSLHNTCATTVCRKLSPWIRNCNPGPFDSFEQPTSNIFIADFIEMDDYVFPKEVIDLNMKLL